MRSPREARGDLELLLLKRIISLLVCLVTALKFGFSTLNILGLSHLGNATTSLHWQSDKCNIQFIFAKII